MKILFFGTPDFAAQILENLTRINNIEIKAVITQLDKKTGRKQVLTPPPVKVIAEGAGIDVLQPKNKKELEEMLEDLEDIDFFIVVAFGMILTSKTLSIPKYGAINIHASLLPKYRGASPIQETLLQGDKETGISIMKMDEDLDHGPVHLIKKVKITPDDNLTTLSEKLVQLSINFLPLSLIDILENQLTAIPQDHSKASYCTKIKKEDGKINWTLNAEEINNKVRAYNPWPSAFTEFNGKKLKILEATISDENIEAGKFILDEKTLKIGTGKGALIPKKVQPEGKQAMDVKDFVNGNRQHF